MELAQFALNPDIIKVGSKRLNFMLQTHFLVHLLMRLKAVLRRRNLLSKMNGNGQKWIEKS